MNFCAFAAHYVSIAQLDRFLGLTPVLAPWSALAAAATALLRVGPMDDLRLAPCLALQLTLILYLQIDKLAKVLMTGQLRHRTIFIAHHELDGGSSNAVLQIRSAQ